jgi:sugar O-acyltransferase (sialic acid O-acetyltransferase NeuD family)
MNKKAIIFGTGSFAEIVDFYLSKDSDYEVVAFTATEGIDGNEKKLNGRPLVSFERIEDTFDPSDHDMFVAVGYKKLNMIREEFCTAAKRKGFKLLSYVCSKATFWGDTKVGENVFIFEDNTIQPYVQISDGTILWSGNHVGHHSRIGRFCFVTSHVVISGHCTIGSHCFLGVNATVSDGTSISERNVIGPGTLIQKSTKADEVYIAERTKKFPKDSSRFFR